MTASALFISYDSLTGQIGQSQVLPYVKGLARRGHRLSLASFEVPDAFGRLGPDVGADLAAAGIEWHPRRFRSRPPLIAKALDQLDAHRSARRLAACAAFEIVHCRSYVAADVGVGLKRRFGTSFIFDMRGFWADQKREGGHWRATHPFYRALYRRWKRKEEIFVSNSDAIVVLTEAAKAEIETWPAWRGAPITVIPCSLDFDRFSLGTPDERDEARRTLGIARQARVLVYLGSLGTVYLLKEMLAFFTAFKARHPDAVFLFVGAHVPVEIVAVAESAGIRLREDDIRVIRAPHAEVPRWLGAADLAISFIIPSYSSRGVSPTKLGEYLAAGLPVICNDGVGDVRTIVEGFNAGHVVTDFTPATLAAAAESMEHYLDRPRGLLRERARQFHDLERAIDSYDAIYRSLLGAEG